MTRKLRHQNFHKKNFIKKFPPKNFHQNFFIQKFPKKIFATIFIFFIFVNFARAGEIYDSDGDGIFDRAEREIFFTDPQNPDSDGDGFRDFDEIQNGYDPLNLPPKKMDKTDRAAKIAKMQNLKNEILNFSNDDFFIAPIGEKFNKFEHRDGLFRFQFANFLEIKKIDEIYFAQTLNEKKIVFQIFPRRENLNFSRENFWCVRNSNENFSASEVCFSRNYDRNLIKNLQTFTAKNEVAEKIARDFVAKKVLKNFNKFDFYRFFTRAEAVAMILKLRFGADFNFQKYAANCFDDVSKNQWHAGFVCFAKNRKIVNGIGNKFFPNSSVNLWGILKLCFTSFENYDLNFDENYFPANIFSQMQTIHAAYEMVAKSLFEGIFENLRNEVLWANRNIVFGEGVEIISNFLKFNSGGKIRNFEKSATENLKIFDENKIIKLPKFDFYEFEKTEIFENKFPQKVLLREKNSAVEVLVFRAGNFFEKFFEIKNSTISEISNLKVSLNFERKKGEIYFEKNGEKNIFKTEVSKNQFEPIRAFYEISGKSKNEKSFLQKISLLPNEIPKPKNEILPEIKIFLADENFLHIFENRTSNQRHPAFLEMVFPDGEILRKSILIKTRGNAGRGYFKSSFTIEAFDDFGENKNFVGDEFLQNSNEFKMRSFINEETHLKEKLFYDASRNLQIPAPEFFSALLQINGIEMGLFQITEPIKKDFFARRKIATSNYFYARNSGAYIDTNLRFYESDDLTASQYKIKNENEKVLLDLIKNLENDDPKFLEKIDARNVVFYAALVFATSASDSLTHNFYVFFDDEIEKWKIFPWDADAVFEFSRELSFDEFYKFGMQNSGSFNNLIYFVFKNLPRETVQKYFAEFQNQFCAQNNFLNFVENFENKNREFLKFDNALFSGKYLERKNKFLNSFAEIAKLKNFLRKLNFNFCR